MDDIFAEMFDKALPFYTKGNTYDAVHIRWLYDTVSELLGDDVIDFDRIMPLLLLHDLGCGDTARRSSQKQRADKSAALAAKLLKDLNFSSKKTAEIIDLIKAYGTWKFTDEIDDDILKAFVNLDILWNASEQGFKAYQERTKKDAKKAYWSLFALADMGMAKGWLWYTDDMKKFFRELLAQRREEYDITA